MSNYQSQVYKCPLCNKSFDKGSSLIRHIGWKHHNIINCHALVYLYQLLSGESIIELYTKVGMSANEISKKIRREYDWMHCQKGVILKFLKQNSIERRKTTTAMECYYERNPVWNKGLTKEDHPAIKSYADKRIGENNPIHVHTPEERSYTNTKNKLKREGNFEEIEKQKLHAILASKDWFSNDKNYNKYKNNFDAAIPKLKSAVRDGLLKYYKKYTDVGQIPPSFAITVSKPEKIVKEALETLNISFKHQYFIDNKPYDFFVYESNTIIEVNGSYWHAHESIFPDENVLHPNKENMTIREVREYDAAKHLKATSQGYNLVVLWEHEFDTIEEVIQLLKERLNAKDQIN